jgi:hypothetical protein
MASSCLLFPFSWPIHKARKRQEGAQQNLPQILAVPSSDPVIICKARRLVSKWLHAKHYDRSIRLSGLITQKKHPAPTPQSIKWWDDAPDCGMAEKQYSANNQSGPDTPLYSCLFPVKPCNFLHHKLESHNNGKHNQTIFSKNSHWRCLLVKSCSAPKSFNLGMKILKATNYTMGVPLSISTYLGPQLVEHIRLSLIIESKSKQFHSRYLQIITSLPYPTHIYTPITSCSEEATSLLLIKQDHPMKSFLHKYWEMLHTYDLRKPETNWEMTQ